MSENKSVAEKVTEGAQTVTDVANAVNAAAPAVEQTVGLLGSIFGFFAGFFRKSK